MRRLIAALLFLGCSSPEDPYDPPPQDPLTRCEFKNSFPVDGVCQDVGTHRAACLTTFADGSCDGLCDYLDLEQGAECGCWCDEYCEEYGDCCGDYSEVCEP